MKPKVMKPRYGWLVSDSDGYPRAVYFGRTWRGKGWAWPTDIIQRVLITPVAGRKDGKS